MLDNTMRPTPGDLINGKYRLLRLIGDGGMGSVYEARHEFLGTSVALKFLHPELASRPGLVARFLQEARLAASIRSPHIAHVTDVDQAGEGAAYLVMELLHGESLQALLDREHRLSRDVALDYTLQILAGLEAAHAIGAVHRDLKPDNVFVVSTPHGPWVKLLDFGIAKLRTSREFQVALTRPGVVMGTPEYMAPEQAFSAESVDVRADIYAVGVMLYEMLTGERPLQGDDAREIAARVMAQNFANVRQIDPTVPEALAQLVHRAMASIPAHRFASASEMRDAITPWCGTLSVAGKLAATPSPPPAGLASGGPPVSPRVSSAAQASPAPGRVGSGTQNDERGVAPTFPRPTDLGAGAAPARAPLPSTASMPAPPPAAAPNAGPPASPGPARAPGSGRPAVPIAVGAPAAAVPPPGGVNPKGATAPMPAVGAAFGQPRPHTQHAPAYLPAGGYGSPPAPMAGGSGGSDGFGAQVAGAPGGPGAASPYGPGPAFGGAAGSAAASYLQAAPRPGKPTRSGGPRGVSLGVLGAVAGAAGVIIAVVVMAIRGPQNSTHASASQVDPAATQPLSAIPTAQAPAGPRPTAPIAPAAPPTAAPNPIRPTAAIPPAVQPTAAPPPQPTAQSPKPTATKPRDAGAPTPPTIPIWDGGFTLPTLPIPFPSQLPIPTALPTNFPIPIPGFPGAQSPAAADSR